MSLQICDNLDNDSKNSKLAFWPHFHTPSLPPPPPCALVCNEIRKCTNIRRAKATGQKNERKTTNFLLCCFAENVIEFRLLLFTQPSVSNVNTELDIFKSHFMQTSSLHVLPSFLFFFHSLFFSINLHLWWLTGLKFGNGLLEQSVEVNVSRCFSDHQSTNWKCQKTL